MADDKKPVIDNAADDSGRTAATEELIKKAKISIKEKNIRNAEFQFFYGVKNRLAKELRNEGFKTTIYIPYGNLISYVWNGFHTFLNFRNIQRILHFKKIY